MINEARLLAVLEKLSGIGTLLDPKTLLFFVTLHLETKIIGVTPADVASLSDAMTLNLKVSGRFHGLYSK